MSTLQRHQQPHTLTIMLPHQKLTVTPSGEEPHDINIISAANVTGRITHIMFMRPSGQEGPYTTHVVLGVPMLSGAKIIPFDAKEDCVLALVQRGRALSMATIQVATGRSQVYIHKVWEMEVRGTWLIVPTSPPIAMVADPLPSFFDPYTGELVRFTCDKLRGVGHVSWAVQGTEGTAILLGVHGPKLVAWRIRHLPDGRLGIRRTESLAVPADLRPETAVIPRNVTSAAPNTMVLECANGVAVYAYEDKWHLRGFATAAQIKGSAGHRDAATKIGEVAAIGPSEVAVSTHGETNAVFSVRIDGERGVKFIQRICRDRASVGLEVLSMYWHDARLYAFDAAGLHEWYGDAYEHNSFSSIGARTPKMSPVHRESSPKTRRRTDETDGEEDEKRRRLA